MIKIDGEYTTAHVMGLDDGNLEENCREQIQEMVNHEAFTNNVRVMPDTHYGAGAVIGFTMPLSGKVIPNIVGVDIGCGMESARLGSSLSLEGEELDSRIRDRVPMGYGKDGLSAPNREYYHVKDQFPWETVNERLVHFIDLIDSSDDSELQRFLDDGGYDIDYFKDLCQRVGADLNWAINSVGTLGAGNHFIEIGQSDSTGDYWVTIHSGSRNLGANTAEYWQERASHLRQVDAARTTLGDLPAEYLKYVKFDLDAVSDQDLLDWLQGAKGESFVDYEYLKDDFEASSPGRIEEIGNELKSAIPDGFDSKESLAYLEDEEAYGYFIDMIFCQQYAVENRKMMAQQVADVLGVDIKESITSTHNFIDFRDGIIRKGATRSHDGERAVVPMNMREGTLVVEGKGNPEWNNSVCHGAGRVMSRREAKESLTLDEAEAVMKDVFTTEIPLDEAPQVYKDAALIEEAIEPTADIVDRFEVVHNIKAPS